ncbi:beta-lactamase family protein [bacterium SCSIO 12741]|nr:beta-lactamase family protein [bacterium SCSIO 12741]
MKYTFLALTVVGLLGSCSPTSSSDSPATVYNEKSKILDSLYTELHQYGEFNGNVLVAENDTIIFQKSFGLAKRETGQMLEDNSVFNLASVTKQFTATAIALLAKEQKLSLDDELAKHIPELEFYQGITINHLVRHTSGLPDYMQLWDEKGDTSQEASNSSVIELFAKEKPDLLFEPNEKMRYSNTGYLLLATIVERVSNQSFGAFLDERIFTPLDMKDTKLLFVYKDGVKLNKLTAGYSQDSTGSYVPNIEYAQIFDGVYGQGRLYSTTTDLFKWHQGLRKYKLLSEEETKSLFSPSTLNSEEEINYGFGWFLKDDENYGKIAAHSGGWAGYVTYLETHLDDNKVMIILQNNGNATGKTRIPMQNTRRVLYNEPLESQLRLPTDLLKKYAGTYVSEKGKDKVILLEHQSLWMVLDKETKLELIPDSKTKFIVDGFSPEVTYEFFLDDQGDVEKYRVQQPEHEIDRIAMRKKAGSDLPG